MILSRNIVRGVFLSFLSALGLYLCLFYGQSVQASENPHFRILIYGDSLSAGFGLPTKQGFAPQLKKALRQKNIIVEIDNASISGETSAGGAQRLAWVLSRLPKPDLAILELGANDALRTFSPTQTARNLEKMILIFKKRKIETLIAGMRAPPNLGKNYTRQFDYIYPKLAKKYNLILYPFFLNGVAGNPALNLRDGIHPNRQGIEKIITQILPFVEKAIKKVKGE